MNLSEFLSAYGLAGWCSTQVSKQRANEVHNKIRFISSSSEILQQCTVFSKKQYLYCPVSAAKALQELGSAS